jgi:hypothetical protein
VKFRSSASDLAPDVSNLTGFEPPSIVDRHFFVLDWARAAQHRAGFIIGAFVYSEEDLTPPVFETLKIAGLAPGMDEFEERPIQQMREEDLLRPTHIKPVESEPEAEKKSPVDRPEDETPF